MPEEQTTTPETTESSQQTQEPTQSPESPETSQTPAAEQGAEQTSTDKGTIATGEVPETKQGDTDEQTASTDVGAVPDSYELPEPPQGLEADPKLLDIMSPVLREAGITDKQFAKLAPAYYEVEVARMQREAREVDQQIESWREEVRDDPQIGGDNLAETGQMCKTALSRLCDNEEHHKDVVELLQDTGIGNHRAIVRLLRNAGMRLSDDTFVGAASGAAPTPSGEAALASEYPAMAASLKKDRSG